MNGPDCPIHKTPTEYLATINEWRWYCKACDKRYNDKWQTPCPYCYEPCKQDWCGRCERITRSGN